MQLALDLAENNGGGRRKPTVNLQESTMNLDKNSSILIKLLNKYTVTFYSIQPIN